MILRIYCSAECCCWFHLNCLGTVASRGVNLSQRRDGALVEVPMGNREEFSLPIQLGDVGSIISSPTVVHKCYFTISVMTNTFGNNNFDIILNDGSVKNSTQKSITRRNCSLCHKFSRRGQQFMDVGSIISPPTGSANATLQKHIWWQQFWHYFERWKCKELNTKINHEVQLQPLS